jgi:hypothetical protein
MPESNRIIDRELAALERQLQQTVPLVAPRQRDQLLYSCGLETGRAQSRQSTLRWSTAAAALGIFAGGLLTAAIGGRSTQTPAGDLAESKHSVKKEAAPGPHGRDPTVGVHPTASRKTAVQRAAARPDAGQLTVGTRWGEDLALIGPPARPIERAAIRRDLDGQPLHARSKFVE